MSRKTPGTKASSPGVRVRILGSVKHDGRWYKAGEEALLPAGVAAQLEKQGAAAREVLPKKESATSGSSRPREVKK